MTSTRLLSLAAPTVCLLVVALTPLSVGASDAGGPPAAYQIGPPGQACTACHAGDEAEPGTLDTAVNAQVQTAPYAWDFERPSHPEQPASCLSCHDGTVGSNVGCTTSEPASMLASAGAADDVRTQELIRSALESAGGGVTGNSDEGVPTPGEVGTRTQEHSQRAGGNYGCATCHDMPGLVGSPHDFSGEPWSGGQLCAPCHKPHYETPVTSEELWNRPPTTAFYALYPASRYVGQPTDSKLCLSCHDGTVPMDSFAGQSGTVLASGRALLGTDLRRHHPIGMTYDRRVSASIDHLYDPEVQPSGLGGTVMDDMLGGTGNLGCASCHDVHNRRGNRYLLRLSNETSELCRACHDI